VEEEVRHRRGARYEAHPALLPVRVAETSAARRGEPVTVLLRSGHILKLGRDFDETAFARMVQLLERS